MPKKIAELIKRVELCMKQRDYGNLNALIVSLKKAGGQNEFLEVGYDDTGRSIKCTLLMNFVMQGNYYAVKFLLEGDNPADATIRNDLGETALYLAVAFACENQGYDLKIIDILLKHSPQAQVVSANNNGLIPLAVCVSQRRVDLAKMLLQIIPKEQVLYRNRNGLPPLHVALMNGHLEMVQLLLQYHPEEQLRISTVEEFTAISCAIQSGNLAQFRWLIQFFPMVIEIRSKGQTTALSCASNLLVNFKHDQMRFREILEIVKFILQFTNGAQVCIPDGFGFIPINIACEQGFVELAELLLGYRPEEQLDFIEPENFTPILSACYYGKLPVLNRLLQCVIPATAERHLLRKAKPKGSIVNGLHIAIENSGKYPNYPHIEIIKALLRLVPDQQLEAQDDVERTALFLAVVRRQPAIVELLCSYRNQRQFLLTANKEVSPIYKVIENVEEIKDQEDEKNNRKIFDLLLRCGPVAQLKIAAHDGWLPIHKACELELFYYAAILLNKDPSQLDIPRRDGWYPLHIAVHFNNELLTENIFLSKYRANRMQANQFGVIPLHIACGKGNRKILTALLAEHCEEQLHAKTVMGSTPLHFAIEGQDRTAIQVLLEKARDRTSLLEMKDGDGWNSLHGACLIGALPVVEVLANEGADLEAVGVEGFRALHIACLKNYLTIVNYLFDKGVQINVFNGRGDTPLHIAVEQNNPELVRIIVAKIKEQTLDVDIAQNGKISPLCRAVVFGCYEVMLVLVNAGANVNWQTAIKGQIITPLRLAVEKACDIKTFQWLLFMGADPRQQLEDGKTVIDIIRSFEDGELKEMFLTVLNDVERNQTLLKAFKIYCESEERTQPQNIVHPQLTKISQQKAPHAQFFVPCVATCSTIPVSVSMGVDEGQSGRAYLKEQGVKDERLKQLEIERKQKRIRELASKRKHKIPVVSTSEDDQSERLPATWFQGQLSERNEAVMPIANPAGVRAYCYLPQQCLEKQGCYLPANLSRRHLKFGSRSIKKLDDREKYKNIVHLPDGREKEVKYTHEFKINGLDRVFLFELESDGNNACLYIGSEFVPAGVHTKEQIRAVSQSGKLKRDAVVIDLPLPGNQQQISQLTSSGPSGQGIFAPVASASTSTSSSSNRHALE